MVLLSTAQALSPREYEVADLVALGYNNQAIAWILDLAPRSVERYIALIFSKVGVTNSNILSQRVIVARVMLGHKVVIP